MPIRPELRHLYRSPEWELARKTVFERAGGRCEHCFRSAGSSYFNPETGRLVKVQIGAAHRDHCRDLSRFYDLDNLLALDRACHLAFDKDDHRFSRSARKDRTRPLLAPLEASA
jgi:hypothetical protein